MTLKKREKEIFQSRKVPEMAETSELVNIKIELRPSQVSCRLKQRSVRKKRKSSRKSSGKKVPDHIKVQLKELEILDMQIEKEEAEQRLEALRQRKGQKSARNINKDLKLSPKRASNWANQQLVLAKKLQKKREALR